MPPGNALPTMPSGTCRAEARSPATTGVGTDFFATRGPRSTGTFGAERVDVLVGEQVIAAFQHAIGQRNGKRLDLTACQVMSFRDGRIAEVRGHYADQYQLDEFWS